MKDKILKIYLNDLMIVFRTNSFNENIYLNSYKYLYRGNGVLHTGIKHIRSYD